MVVIKYTCLRLCRELGVTRDAGEPSVEAIPDVDGVRGSISPAPFCGVAGTSGALAFPLSFSGLRGTHDGGARFLGGGTTKGPRSAVK